MILIIIKHYGNSSTTGNDYLIFGQGDGLTPLWGAVPQGFINLEISDNCYTLTSYLNNKNMTGQNKYYYQNRYIELENMISILDKSSFKNQYI